METGIWDVAKPGPRGQVFVRGVGSRVRLNGQFCKLRQRNSVYPFAWDILFPRSFRR